MKGKAIWREFMLLAVVAASATVWLRGEIDRCRREEAALRLLRKLQGQRSVNVMYGYRFGNDVGTHPLFFRGGPEWLTRQLGCDIFRTVKGITVYAPGNRFMYRAQGGRIRIVRKYVTGLTDERAILLTQFPYLTRLSLEANPISDDGVRKLATLKQLRFLNLSNTAITDKSSAISQLPRLEDLNISRTDVGDTFVQMIPATSPLRALNIEVTNISEQARRALSKRLPQCKVRK